MINAAKGVRIRRTVRPVAYAPEPRLPVPLIDASSAMPVADQIRGASSHRRRAEILLRLPDALLAGHATELEEACREAGFGELGRNFIQQRLVALHATRRPDGRQSQNVLTMMDIWCDGLLAAVEQLEPRE
ncbi:hypothetical protein [Microcystis phage Mwe-Yong1]|nr:hypothetical protein [Microcystis phage Mwe-Yong1]